MKEIPSTQTHHISGGMNEEITSEMPDFSPLPFEKFYTIIIKTLCDYHNNEIDLSLI
ncbi:MAG: hypothetical protein HYX61_10220 [Gammaproteobacteria bacterium]|jgi:hypothetical protein|nr:hypothetical protein [Gammaproteobacteria bacterium]